MRLVVLHRLRHPGFDLRYPRRLRRVGREELGGLARSLAGQLGHADPEVPGGVRVIAGLGHEDETEVVRLGFLRPAPRQKNPDGGPGTEERGEPLADLRRAE